MTPLLTSALATCSRSASSVAVPKRASSIVVDGNRLGAAAERTERDPLVEERLGD